MKEGWEYKKIDDISTIVGRIGFRGYTKNDLVSKPELGAITLSPSNIINGELSFEKCSYISLKKYEESPEIMLAEGDVVLVKTASIGKCSIVRSLPHKATLNPQFVVFKNIKIDNEYFNYYIKSPYFQKSLKTIVGGVAIPTLSQKKLGQLEIYFPTSYDEQRRIVSYLDSSFKLIDEIKNKALKSLTEAKALFQSALAEAMEPKEGWEEKTLGEICLIVGRIGFRGYTRKDIVTNKKDGAITLSPSNIVNGNMCYNNCTYISWFKYNESPEIKIQNGDILIVKTGSSYGKSAFVENLPHKATINPQFVVLKDIKINHKFLSYQLKTKKTYDYINSIVSGSAIPTFSQANLSKMLIGVPNIPTQHQIVSHLDSLSSKVRAIEEKYQRIVAECDAMKQAMLREVFE